MRYLLAIPVIAIIIWIILLKCKHQPSAKIIPPVSLKSAIKSAATTDSLIKRLNITTDSFNRLKPVIQQAIDRIKQYEELLKDYKKQSNDNSLEIKRLRSDLYEARLEFKRLDAPRWCYLNNN